MVGLILWPFKSAFYRGIVLHAWEVVSPRSCSPGNPSSRANCNG